MSKKLKSIVHAVDMEDSIIHGSRVMVSWTEFSAEGCLQEPPWWLPCVFCHLRVLSKWMYAIPIAPHCVWTFHWLLVPVILSVTGDEWWLVALEWCESKWGMNEWILGIHSPGKKLNTSDPAGLCNNYGYTMRLRLMVRHEAHNNAQMLHECPQDWTVLWTEFFHWRMSSGIGQIYGRHVERRLRWSGAVGRPGRMIRQHPLESWSTTTSGFLLMLGCLLQNALRVWGRAYEVLAGA